MSKKRAIILFLSAILLGFLMIQPFNYMCRATDKCNPIILSYYLPKMSGKYNYEIFFKAKNYNKEIQFEPLQNSQIVANGQNATVVYRAKNNSRHDIEIRPMPYIEPSEAAQYIKFYECLCFKSRKIKAGKSLDLTVRFNLDKKIEDDKFFQESAKIIMIGYEVN